MTKKTQVVTYMRVTNQKQVREDYSLEQQQKILRDYANKNNLKIVAEFTDSESAMGLSRKEIKERGTFLNSSKNCSTILVNKIARLIRRIKDLALVDEGITIRSSRGDLAENLSMDYWHILFSNNREQKEKRIPEPQIKKQRQLFRKLEKEIRKEVNNVK